MRVKNIKEGNAQQSLRYLPECQIYFHLAHDESLVLLQALSWVKGWELGELKEAVWCQNAMFSGKSCASGLHG